MSCAPYATVVGSRMYEMVFNIPYITHGVGLLARFMSKLGNEHSTIVKQVFKYFCGTSVYGLCYEGRPILDRALNICGFVYAD